MKTRIRPCVTKFDGMDIATKLTFSNHLRISPTSSYILIGRESKTWNTKKEETRGRSLSTLYDTFVCVTCRRATDDRHKIEPTIGRARKLSRQCSSLYLSYLYVNITQWVRSYDKPRRVALEGHSQKHKNYAP